MNQIWPNIAHFVQAKTELYANKRIQAIFVADILHVSFSGLLILKGRERNSIESFIGQADKEEAKVEHCNPCITNHCHQTTFKHVSSEN